MEINYIVTHSLQVIGTITPVRFLRHSKHSFVHKKGKTPSFLSKKLVDDEKGSEFHEVGALKCLLFSQFGETTSCFEEFNFR